MHEVAEPIPGQVLDFGSAAAPSLEHGPNTAGLANELADGLNATSNQGTSLPLPSTLTGTTTVTIFKVLYLSEVECNAAVHSAELSFFLRVYKLLRLRIHFPF